MQQNCIHNILKGKVVIYFVVVGLHRRQKQIGRRLELYISLRDLRRGHNARMLAVLWFGYKLGVRGGEHNKIAEINGTIAWHRAHCVRMQLSLDDTDWIESDGHTHTIIHALFAHLPSKHKYFRLYAHHLILLLLLLLWVPKSR